MRKLILVAFTLFACNWASTAQMSAQVTYQFGLPVTEYSGNMGTSVAGANLKLGFWKDEYLRFNIGTGFYQMPYNDILVDGVARVVDGANLSIIPVTVGAEFYFLGETADKQASKIKPFFGLDLGYAFTMQSESNIAPAKNRNEIIFAPTFGIAYKMSEYLDFVVAARNNVLIYQRQDVARYIQPFQLLGINVGFNYKF
jgi:hypothetical protein